MNIFKDMSLPVRMILGGIAVVVIPFVIAGLVTYTQLSQSLEHLAEEKARQIAVDLSTLAQNTLRREFNFVSAVAGDAEIKTAAASGNYSYIQKKLIDVFRLSGTYEGSLFMTDKNGIQQADAENPKRNGLDVSDRPYFQTAKAGKANIGVPITARPTGTTGITLCAPIISEKHGFVGAAVIFLEIKFLLNPMNAITLGKTGRVYLGDSRGTILVNSDNKSVPRTTNEEQGVKPLAGAMKAGKTGTARYTFRGVKKMTTFAPIPITGWNVMVTQNVDEIMEPVNRILNMIILGGIIFLGITAVSIIILSKKISTPAQKAIETLRQVTLHSGEMVAIIGKDKRIEFVNLAMEKLMKRPSDAIIGTPPVLTNTSDIPEEEIWHTLDTGSVWAGRLRVDEGTGHATILETMIIPFQNKKGHVLNYLEICRDITHELMIESRLYQSQKMESLGVLTGGIAHDFNNILTALMGYGMLLQMKVDKDDPLRVFVNQIVSGTQRAADLTQGLLAFSRQKPVTFSTIRINGIIKGTEGLLKRLVTEDVAIKTDLAADDPAIVADATQIDQVFFNLAANARDAMPNGGILTIETKVVELDDKFVQVHGYGEPGKYVLISVSDTGMGMDNATRERIFDPFFTTKEVGKGTGLGLSTVYGIVKQHVGYITVYSEPNIGTTFRIYFPVVDKVAEKESSTTKPIRGGEETILLAEDNEAVRELMKTILTQYGYTIVEAIDGVDAVEQFTRADRIDLLILDSVMPRKNGREAYNEINKIKPGIKVLFTSGYTKDVILNKGIEDKEFNFISKPIQPIALLNKVREILDG